MDLLSIPDYLQPLIRFSAGFPEEAVKTALARRDETVPALVNALEWVATYPEEVDGDFILHEFALRILAQLQAPEGLAPALRIARSPNVEDLLGDTVTETLPSILASLALGRWQDLQSLIEDEQAYEFARSAGVEALAVLFRKGGIARSDLSQYVGSLFDRLDRKPGFVWDALVDLCAELKLQEHRGAILQAFANDCASPSVEPLQHILARLESGREDFGQYKRQLYTDAARDMADWPGFSSESEVAPLDQGLFAALADATAAPPVEPSVEELERLLPKPKTGRNDPCPCGSGRKYKKCCGR